MPRSLGRWSITVVAGALMFLLLGPQVPLCEDRTGGEAERHNELGLEYFRKGFYDHGPKNESEESLRCYGLAIREFKTAVSKNPSAVEPYRNLARVYFVQKDFGNAAEAYRKVTELQPGDLDAYVNLALALVELEKFDEAVGALENAKRNTSDAQALGTLDRYITRVREHQTKEARR